MGIPDIKGKRILLGNIKNERYFQKSLKTEERAFFVDSSEIYCTHNYFNVFVRTPLGLIYEWLC